MSKKILNPPSPKMLINSIRQIGYSFESAVSDIIDNSISASAKNIDIFFPVNSDEKMYTAFVDDGSGMSRKGVINALKIGSSFEGERKQNDLGRFGLGLKSASFSQCRKLTVASKVNDQLVAFGWDIDDVEKSNEWFCNEYSSNEIKAIPQIDKISILKNGTLVVWREFDLISSKLESVKDLHRQLSNILELTRTHIGLHFHRYLNKKLVISINNVPIVGLDPFLENHLKIEKGQLSSLSLKAKNNQEYTVQIQPYTLPHYLDLSDEDIALLGGIDKIRAGQGFYIYRQERLIVHNTWFGIGAKAEVFKYARIKVDIPNTLDDIWDIDVKKQNAAIPAKLLAHFRKTVGDIQLRSKKKTRHKQLAIGQDDNKIWNKKKARNGKESYYINLDSKFINEYINENFHETSYSKIYSLLEIIGSTIPFDAIYNSVCNQCIDTDLDSEKEREIIEIAKNMALKFAQVKKIGIDKSLQAILNFEPFNHLDIKKVLKELGCE
ncbi:MAG: ATP-binding protein [Christensenellaceae bacterium]|jgi:hypothetical protein|nr:ATP-binding protein [Christensenellaceae bacterium]